MTPRNAVTEPSTRLFVELLPSGGSGEGEGHVLAVVRHGRPAPETLPGGLTVLVPMPQFGDPTDEVWRTTDEVTNGEVGGIAFAATGTLLFGAMVVPQRGGRLEEPSLAAYRAILTFLQEQGRPHLLRMWNYLPRINDEEEGMERYKRFCVGRAEGFRAVFGEGEVNHFPSATAVGSMADDTLSIHFLASTVEPRHVENPRQISAYRYPLRYGPKSPSFARATVDEANRLVFIAGTASITGAESRHEGDCEAQFAETMENIDALVEKTGAIEKEGLYRIYIRRPEDYPMVKGLFETDRPGRRAQFLQADVCRSELLIEIEMVAPVG